MGGSKTSAGAGAGQKQSLLDQLLECRRSQEVLETKNLTAEMHPVIQYGDMLSVKACTAEDLDEGDLFYYQSGTTVKLRKFLKRKYQHHEMHILAKAESLKSPDDPVRPSLVLGKVTAVRRAGKAVNPKDPGMLRKILAGLGLLSLSS